ncbi:hypothetical protein N8J89_30535 [Crossiella sp. CA-258035]|uniref:hypothetical protein n=1 Tax=Crossiella sp. CA-258035 TaxID=2981138 RepID=UPI0024BCE06B|nr:hypothetical protein [Crossiella sp. CA-258035]WHT17438.1 hypothetical protein N8J89_30535 [Crossiella sp. CA-258035]
MKRVLVIVMALAGLAGLGSGLAAAFSAQVSTSVDGGRPGGGCVGGCGIVLAECGHC